MPQEPLDLCEIDPNNNGDPNNANRNSVLYNAMIHPLIRISIKGALWYQGIKLICLFQQSQHNLKKGFSIKENQILDITEKNINAHFLQ